jgi:ElaB/YqjD/DUF883 family membrane-anchored ribosome-binding protein
MNEIERALAKANAKYDAMTPEEQAAMWRAQAESWARGMEPCEHGERDYEQCPKCRESEAMNDPTITGAMLDAALQATLPSHFEIAERVIELIDGSDGAPEEIMEVALKAALKQLAAERDAACSLLRESREELHDGDGEPVSWAKEVIARIDRFLAAHKEPKT